MSTGPGDPLELLSEHRRVLIPSDPAENFGTARRLPPSLRSPCALLPAAFFTAHKTQNSSCVPTLSSRKTVQTRKNKKTKSLRDAESWQVPVAVTWVGWWQARFTNRFTPGQCRDAGKCPNFMGYLWAPPSSNHFRALAGSSNGSLASIWLLGQAVRKVSGDG